MPKLPKTLHESLVEMGSIKTNAAYVISYADVKQLVNARYIVIKFSGGWMMTSKAKDYLNEYS